MIGSRAPKAIGPLVLALLMGCLSAGIFGCGAGAGVRQTNGATYQNGADGEREVAEGPGLFSGEKGGVEFTLTDLLHRRDQHRAGGEARKDGPE
ncbi:MAG: hypothetical protein P1P84_00895 [Deferrisomatales bacterium]|nr:hypothetical protein [Deferrisomatales bacterium]